jgi:hypothetical protein
LEVPSRCAPTVTSSRIPLLGLLDVALRLEVPKPYGNVSPRNLQCPNAFDVGPVLQTAQKVTFVPKNRVRVD